MFRGFLLPVMSHSFVYRPDISNLKDIVPDQIFFFGWSKNSSPFMEPEVLLPRSQAPVTSPSSEPDESKPSPHFISSRFLLLFHLCLNLLCDRITADVSKKVTHGSVGNTLASY